MKILVASPGDEYSRVNFIEGFRSMGHEVDHFDFTNRSPEALQGMLPGRYDLLFHVLVNDELSTDLIESLDCTMLKMMWASDDDWRLPVSLAHVGAYDLATTNDPNAIPIYRSKGHGHVVHVQYGFNPKIWKPVLRDLRGIDTASYDADYLKKPYDVTFVGQAYIGRPEFIKALQDRGIDVNVWGQGFPRGSLPHDKMIETLCASKIVLGMNWVAGGSEAGQKPQIKGRIFENAALGVFQLVSADRRLSRYFGVSEIATYDSIGDCADKIRYYLEHTKMREAIAKNGHERAMNDHTWAKRWEGILKNA